MKPKVSIIIPCYNQAKFLPEAIASLQAQTLEDWECIIVDDGSTDNTAETAANWALKDPRIQWIQQNNMGSAAARDVGLRLAKGKYIQFLDADDTITPEKLEKQVDLMDANNLDITYTAFCSERNGICSKTRSVKLNKYRILVNWGLGASVPIHSFMYRLEFITNNALSLKNLCKVNEDWEWHWNCFEKRPKSFLMANYCGAIYKHNESGKTGTYIRMQTANFEFMAHMTSQLKGCAKCLWAFRISEELWVWLLRMLKYRSTAIIKSILLLKPLWIIVSILLMPISFWWVMAYFVKAYIAN